MIDLPGQDGKLQRMSRDQLQDLATQCSNDLYLFARYVMRYKDMTPSCHGLVSNWYDTCPKQFKLILMPRDHFKTTLLTISNTLRRVTRFPNQAQLIVNETGLNASRFLRTIKDHAERNPIFRTLYSTLIPRDMKKVRWNYEELEFVRDIHRPEPTITALGMTGTAVSQHYNHITYDDPISEEAVKSELVMKDAIERTKGATALLTKPSTDTIDWIGTRWALHDIYSWLIATYGDALGMLQLPVVDEDGKMLFPELITPETLALKRKVMGAYKFSCLMLNNPRNADVQDLNIHDLRYWEWAQGSSDTVCLYNSEGKEIDRWHLDQLDITTTVDLAPSESLNSDRNAVVTVGASPRGQAIVLEAWGARCKAYEVVQKLFDTQERFHPRLFGIENVAYQAAFKHFVEQKMLDEGRYLRVVPVKPPGGKKSHVRGIQPLMAVGRLYVNAQQHILINEMSEYPLGEHDDVVDALALQLQVWSGILSPEAREASKRTIDEHVARTLRTARLGSAPVSTERDPDDDQPWTRRGWQTAIIG